jgi:polysaccharide deacetylase family protein (PEP-CTERM system associated)
MSCDSEAASSPDALRVILSFDVEEHHRIEAAAGLDIEPNLRAHCAERMDASTRWVLDQLGQRGIKATFFIVGDIAHTNPGLVRAIHRDGHEIASHGWDHRRVHFFTPATFREDVRRSKDALEQVTGEAVVGYRAPTFSIVRQTAWAIDVLAEIGMLYDSSIYPVRHDRYGVPEAPRCPFLARGREREILELPPATLRLLRQNIPAAGGGYFRLLPLTVMRRAIEQVRQSLRPSVAMLYFHPWEFDPEQGWLPLRAVGRWRTYTGVGRTRGRLAILLGLFAFSRAIEVASNLHAGRISLLSYALEGTDAAATCDALTYGANGPVEAR